MKYKIEATMTWAAEFDIEADTERDAINVVHAMDNAEFYDGVHDEVVSIVHSNQISTDAECPDCGSSSHVSLIGTVCLTCHRGIVKGVGQ